MQQPNLPSATRRLLAASAAALVGMFIAAGSATANEPSSWVLPEDDATIRIPELVPAPLAAPSRTEPEPLDAPSDGTADDVDAEAPPSPSDERRTPRESSTPTPGSGSEPAVGYDISYPQCGDPYPEAFAFAIVGVNGGRVFSPNPCLGPDGDDPSQLAWAGPAAELYINTGNPGPRVSRFWPSGQEEPRSCEGRRAQDEDSLDCSYVYGWNAAEFAYGRAREAFVELGWADEADDRLPGEITVWLDVEPANSWRRDRELNVATLEGAVAYLESVDVHRIGFYSTPRLWDRITGGTDRFADRPAWHAGARDLEDARRRCAEEEAFTGGDLVMVQWVENDLDHNIRCEDAENV